MTSGMNSHMSVECVGAKFENKNNMASGAAFVLMMEELTDDSAPPEATYSEDDEFPFFPLVTSKEREKHVKINSYFKRIVPLYRSYF